jgi:hypothetical protein
MSHNFEKILTRATTFLETSLQSEVYTQSYGPPKLQKSQFWEFRESHLGGPKQNDIWVLALWPSTKNTIRGKVVASPQVWVVVSLVSPCLPVMSLVNMCLPMVRMCIKGVPTMH